jgi:hypothetical protein
MSEATTTDTAGELASCEEHKDHEPTCRMCRAVGGPDAARALLANHASEEAPVRHYTRDGLPCPGTCVQQADELEEARADLASQLVRQLVAICCEHTGDRVLFLTIGGSKEDVVFCRSQLRRLRRFLGPNYDVVKTLKGAAKGETP